MKIILTGATGFVGEGVLLECLKDERVEKVLSISRKPCGHKHEKLEELITKDLLKLPEGDERLAVVGGGHINGSMLDLGLIDEVSVMYGYGIDGPCGP